MARARTLAGTLREIFAIEAMVLSVRALAVDRVTDAARIRCDLSSSKGRWDFAAWCTIGRMLYEQHAVGEADWLFTPEELQADGLEMEEAIATARGVVDVTTAGRFRPETLAVSDDPPVHPPHFPHQTRMDRTDERRLTASRYQSRSPSFVPEIFGTMNVGQLWLISSG